MPPPLLQVDPYRPHQLQRQHQFRPAVAQAHLQPVLVGNTLQILAKQLHVLVPPPDLVIAPGLWDAASTRHAESTFLCTIITIKNFRTELS